ncbi:MAG: Ppx/GppA phosphatase family protein [Solirubrobacteraceae bacterium]
MTLAPEHRSVVVDLGSNSFRLVVYAWVPGAWWTRVDEIHETVRIGAGLDSTGRLSEEAMERALRTLRLYDHFRRALGVDDADVHPVATSAIRDAANRDEFVARAAEVSGVPVRVLDAEEEAYLGYVAAVNSTTLQDGAVMDLGGGSLQLVDVRERRARRCRSWPLGAVRMTEHYLGGEDLPTGAKALKALRAHVREQLGGEGWLAKGRGRIVGIGGTVRNLASAAELVAGLPTFGAQGFTLTREALGELIGELAARRPSQRGEVPGIKSGRGEIILAGAAVIDTVLEISGQESIEVSEAGLREGAFFTEFLAPADPPLFPDVRGASVRNVALQFQPDIRHATHVADLSLEMLDSLRAGGVDAGDGAERELLWAAAMLHDVGKAVDYDDHHKHSRYLILGAGLPGYEPREVALIAQMTRYHRKGSPIAGPLEPLMRDGDAEMLVRCSAILRLAEHLERGRDQVVRHARLEANGKTVRLELECDGDPSIAVWGAERQAELFERAFGRRLEVVA